MATSSDMATKKTVPAKPALFRRVREILETARISIARTVNTTQVIANWLAERVAERVRQGGHDIPESVIRRRFIAGRKNFENHYRAAVDAWAVYDNSADEPILLEWGEVS